MEPSCFYLSACLDMRSLYPIDLRRRCFLNLDIPGDDKKASKRVSKPASFFFLSIYSTSLQVTKQVTTMPTLTKRPAMFVLFAPLRWVEVMGALGSLV